MASDIRINSRVASTLQAGDVIAQRAYYGQSSVSGPFNPVILFANGEQGAWYDPSDLSTLFQDDAGTTPVTEPGQTVGLMLDKSGNDVEARQTTAESRPIYRDDEGLRYTDGDGVDDTISSAGVLDLSVPEFWLFCAGANPTEAGIPITLNGSNFQYLRIDATQIFARAETGSGNSITGSILPWPTPTVWTVRVRQSDRSVTAWRNGSQVVSMTIRGSDWWPSLSRITLHGAQPNNAQTRSDFYAAGVLISDMGNSTRENLEKWLAQRAGVTL